MAQAIKDEVKQEVDQIVSRGRRQPHLTVILVGENPASKTYIKNKFKAAEYIGSVVVSLLVCSVYHF